MLICLKMNATYYGCDGKIHAIMIVRSWIATFKVAREALNYAKLTQMWKYHGFHWN